MTYPHRDYPPIEHKPERERVQEELMTVREVAKALRVDDTTIRRYIKSGVMEAITLPHRGTRQAYRIRKSTLDALFNTNGEVAS